MEEFLEEWKKMLPVVKEEELKKLDQSPNHPETRVTPHLINRLAVGEILYLAQTPWDDMMAVRQGSH